MCWRRERSVVVASVGESCCKSSLPFRYAYEIVFGGGSGAFADLGFLFSVDPHWLLCAVLSRRLEVLGFLALWLHRQSAMRVCQHTSTFVTPVQKLAYSTLPEQ